MATTEFKTKKGDLTAYALACGYIETAVYRGGVVILEAFHYDKPCYCVSWWEGKYKCNSQTYRLLIDARRESLRS
jgi:hypothetical protein